MNGPTRVMGIVNVTPDSFCDGGRYATVERAAERARNMAVQGAHIIDIGGESTRPGATPVCVEEEMRRVVPVLDALIPDRLCLSIDTTKPEVAKAALDRGVRIVNDVHGGADAHMRALVASYDAVMIVMHALPMDVWSTTDHIAHMRALIARAKASGIRDERIWIDPGFGFAKDRAANIALMRNLRDIVALGHTVVIGTSRKRFVRETVGTTIEGALAATLATAVIAQQCGVHVVRVHDVAEHVHALHMAHVLCGEQNG
jgi:dihydropteroate synthase